MQLSMTVKGISKLYKDLDIYDKRAKKALDVAIRVEGFRRLKELREAIRKGDPSGAPYAAQLSKIARRTKRGALRKNQVPLYRLARLLRYEVNYDTGLNGAGQMTFSFGFKRTGPRRINSFYRKLVRLHQEGEDVFYTGSRTELGRRFARIGGKLKKKGDPDAIYFFLRKETGRKMHLPERQIIGPYDDETRGQALRNIRRNFQLKMAGERI